MRRFLLMSFGVMLLSLSGCRSSVDLSTHTGQTRFGVQAARMDLWREAQFRFLRAVEMNPQDSMAYNNLAVAYEGIGEYEKAREAYLRALQIDRSNQYIQRNYSRFVEFYSKRNPEKDEDAPEAGKPAEEDPAAPADAEPGEMPEEPVTEAPPSDEGSQEDDQR